MAAQAAACQAKHSVARTSNDGASVAHSATQHHAGTVAAGRAGVTRVHAQHIEHVPAWWKQASG